MDYSQLLHELQQASLFDLYRLQSGINKMLDQPDKIAAIKRSLRLGQEIRYFEQSENRLIQATVKELNRTRVLVRNSEDSKLWSIRYYTININNVNTDIHSRQGKITKNHLKIGDTVGYYDRLNREQYGEIIRLNQKTVTMNLKTGEQWRVPYRLLFQVMDGESAQVPEAGLIEGEIIDNNPIPEHNLGISTVHTSTTGSGASSDNAGKKLGRNSPCPCGSGKKFKTCCLVIL